MTVKRKRHYPHCREKYGAEFTLCGQPSRKGALLAKAGEAVNCKSCLAKYAKLKKR